MKNFINTSNTEEEQVEKISKWLKNNGMQIVAGITIGLSAVWGWDSYSDYQDKEAENARTLYLNYVSDTSNTGAYDQLLSDYSSSSYTDQAMLMMAKQLFDGGNYDGALSLIEPLTSSDDIAINSTAILRTASVYLQLGQHQDALSILDSLSSASFSGLVNNMKGDIYVDLNDSVNAKKHYGLALNSVTANSTLAQLIQIKLDDLN